MREKSLEYHIGGKLGTYTTKSMQRFEDLSLAYSPGVAHPCIEIAKDPQLAYRFTNKANTVAVISDGSAVLGLGDIGPLASKPVMEGKCCLFLKFAGVNALDIELDVHDTGSIISAIRAIAPSFGGINLEDIAAPKCFVIEAALQDLGIPVMHDDQHGTAIISSAGIINAAQIVGKKLANLKVVVNGAGAAGLASAAMYKRLGIEDITLVDSRGVINTDRTDLNDYKKPFATSTKNKSLAEALKGADVFLGLSKPGVLDADMLKSMAASPVVFALANPIPEMMPDEAKRVRADVIVGTGRSDFDNQINNVLGFPYIFRGALDVRASKITEHMKLAAAQALASLAQMGADDYLKEIYKGQELEFGPNMVVPKPFDRRAKAYVSTAIARSAIEDGVAKNTEINLDSYLKSLLDN